MSPYVKSPGDMIIRFAHPKGLSRLEPQHYVGMISAYSRPPIPPSEHAVSHILTIPPNTQNKTTQMGGLILWSGRHDSNMRHLGPKPSTLPG